MKKLMTLFLFVFLNHSLVWAQDARTWRFSLGAGYAFKKNLRVGNTYDKMDKKFLSRPIPFIQGGYGRVSLGPQGLSVIGVGNHLMNVSAFINRGGDRYHGAGMLPKKDSFFAGLSAKFFAYGFNLSKDINGRSKGSIAQLSYGKMFLPFEKTMLRASVNLEWFDDKYAEYYYSVRSFEALPTRAEYHLNNYFQPGISFMPIYKIDENSSFIGALSFKLLPRSVSHSPTMNGDRIETGGLFGYSYNF